MGNFPSKLITKYSFLLDKYPLLTRSTTASILAGCGDLISQVFFIY